LLICDATNEQAILLLRKRKRRPSKPLALLYASIEMAKADVELRAIEMEALKSKAAPVVLCKRKVVSQNNICADAIASGLDKIGLMLPSTPLLSLLADKIKRPLVATSGNISGSPVVYKDADALDNLFDIADYILTFDRDIVTPQDDSVIQFNEHEQRIVLRRSRGLAPNYFPNPFLHTAQNILACGGEFKSAFAYLNQSNLYVSQFLGDQSTIESQESYRETVSHLTGLLQSKPEKIIVDKHPQYFVSAGGKELAHALHIEAPLQVQHHKAHFAAVLAENNLITIQEPVLGFIWDGTGYGDDQQIWGSESFLYQDYTINRLSHLQYFPLLIGDKMSKEPRLSALSLLKYFPQHQQLLQQYFSATEWQYYQKNLQQNNQIQTSSMGRFLDGLACIAGIGSYNTYEGEAAMQMEAMARTCVNRTAEYYPINITESEIDWTVFMHAFLADVHSERNIPAICFKVFYSLAKAIRQISNHYAVNKLAFSGGVFQNALLTDIIIKMLSADKQLYFHQQLSPNDECIGFGQLAFHEISTERSKINALQSTNHSFKSL